MLGLLGGGQCAALLAVIHYGCDLRGPGPTMFILLILTALVGTCLGLILSALANTSEVAISLVPLILLPMVILGGIMQPIHKLDQPGDLIATMMASRWSFEGLLVLESDARPTLIAPPEELTDPDEHQDQDTDQPNKPAAATPDRFCRVLLSTRSPESPLKPQPVFWP